MTREEMLKAELIKETMTPEERKCFEDVVQLYGDSESLKELMARAWKAVALANEEIEASWKKLEIMSMEELLSIADQNPDAQFELGNRYANNEDYAQAAEWFRKAAEQGNPEAQMELAQCYDNGWGVPRDEAQAAEWYCMAAEDGGDTVHKCLELIHAKEKRDPQEESQAAERYRQTAERGDPEAQLRLGICCVNGWGVPRDPVQGAEWIRRAAEQDYAEAAYNLAVLYISGVGVPVNGVEALQWCFRAAALGSVKARVLLHDFPVPLDETGLHTESE